MAELSYGVETQFEGEFRERVGKVTETLLPPIVRK